LRFISEDMQSTVSTLLGVYFCFAVFKFAFISIAVLGLIDMIDNRRR
jgi:hypothetical protein